MIYTYPDGKQVDLNSGEIVGQAEPQKLTPEQARRPDVDIQPATATQGALDGIKQLTWGLNSALFALPDSVVRQVGRALNVREEEIPTFAGYFNRGATAPKNAVERYARSIGQGFGATLPFTGVLSVAARTKALTGPLTPSAPITKQIAKETLDFIRQNPKAAVALDLGFGGAYGGVEQLVEESTEPGTARDFLKATVPIGATVGLPMVGSKLFGLAQKLWSISPTANVIRRVAGAGGPPSAPGPIGIPAEAVDQAVAETVPKIPGLKGPFGMVGHWYGSKAQKGISDRLKEILSKEVSPDIEEQLRLTREIENIAQNAGFEDIKFIFSLPEATLNAPLLEAYRNVVKNASPEVLADVRKRLAANDEAFLNLAQRLEPESQMPFSEALAMHAAERTRVMDDALKNVADLSDAERLRIMDSINRETNISDIGQSLRSGIIAQREAVFDRFRTLADTMTARPFGARVPTREGVLEPIEGIPRVPFANFATGFLKKYNLTPANRWFSGEVPAPAKDIQKVMTRVNEAKDEAIPSALSTLVREDLSKNNRMFPNLRPEEQDALIKLKVDGVMSGTLGSKADLSLLNQAEELAKKQMQVELTLPEAVDLLQSAQRYRNYMFVKSNQDLEFGLPRAFADQVKRNGDELLSDVEKFVFQSFKDVPRIKELEDAYRGTFTQGYDKLFPLMATKRTPTGEFVMGDEQLVKKALENRENLRSLNAIFGDNPTYARHLENAMMARARDARVITPDGLLNTQGYSNFLARNKSLIDEMPEAVQASLRDELKMGQIFADELAKKQSTIESLKDMELDALVKKAIRPDAEVGPLIKQAINDPAVMRKLVSTVGKDQEALKSLRRAVWKDSVGELTNPNDPLYIAEFLVRHGKSLNILYDKEHLDNLRLLGEIQRRVLAAVRPEGVISPFKTFDVKLREKVGAGIGTIESTSRAVAIQKISPSHAVVSLLSRFLSRQQQSISDKILLTALTDPTYARQLVNATSSLDSPKGFKAASKLTLEAGGFLPTLIRNAPRVATIEAVQALEDETPLPLAQRTMEAAPFPTRPQVQEPRTTVPAMPPRPRNLAEASFPRLQQRAPAAPASAKPTPAAPAPAPKAGGAGRVVPKMPSAPPPAGPSQGPQGQQLYQMLFPNDLVSPMMQRPQ
jgi:hypothetical protein